MTVTRTRDEAETTAKAEAVLRWADSLPWPSGPAYDILSEAAQGLRDALDDHGDLETGDLHPASKYHELACCWPDDALGQALEKSLAEISDRARDLALAVGTHIETRCAA